jgi:hypothetical protein
MVTPEVRAAALADLAAGDQPAVVADRYKLNRQTVKAWKARLGNMVASVQPDMQPDMQPGVQPDARPVYQSSLAAQQQRVVELVYQNLIAKLTAVEHLAHHVTTNDEWLNRQSADGIATLGGWLDTTAAATLALLANHDPERPAE